MLEAGVDSTDESNHADHPVDRRRDAKKDPRQRSERGREDQTEDDLNRSWTFAK